MHDGIHEARACASRAASREAQLLNGWWDFLPVSHPDLAAPLNPTAVPADGWQRAAYLVPGFFTDHAYPESWRSGGYLAPERQQLWTHRVNNRSGWMRTRFRADPRPGRRAFLTIGAAIPQAHIFLNGRKLGVQDDMFLGEPLEVTAALRAGENELAVLLTEFRTFPHPDKKTLSLIDVPWGCCISQQQAGIWQDVELEWRPEAHVADVTIRTSVRQQSLTVLTTVVNLGNAAFCGALRHSVEDAGAVVLALPPVEVALAPREQREFAQTVSWSGYRPWSPHDPHLYRLCTALGDDRLATRFGFREVWIEGHRLLLNGVPQRWTGEWCHKAHGHWLRPEYVRQWYRQIKDLHGNYVRMHTFPHPGYFLDLADELGLVVAQETALHGSGPLGFETPQLWERARDHIRRLVRRDKNHPSLALWSVENEMRWSLNLVPGAREELPKLRALFNALDPTRPAYHDGDSSLWDENRQPIISRHYGAACTGLGWWTKRAPLHAGEVGNWHFAAPHIAMEWAGDEVFADYRALAESLARECARVIELGRANEVSCLFYWNTSGLDNFRPPQEKEFAWPEPCSRYLKPLKHLAYESEYAWWDSAGPGYRPGWSFPIVRHACRPLAVVIREERAQAFTDRPLPHTAMLVNDLPETVEGELIALLEQQGRTLWRGEARLRVASGETGSAAWRVPLDAAAGGAALLRTVFRCPQGEDTADRRLSLATAAARREPLALPPVAVWGPSTIRQWLAGHGVPFEDAADAATLDPQRTPLLVIGEHTVLPGSPLHRHVREFVRRGGRVLVLEQTYSLFPGLPMIALGTEAAHVRDPFHPALAGIRDEDLRGFGDDPYGIPSSDNAVVRHAFEKPKDGKRLVRTLADCSRGGFGGGGLNAAALIEVRLGRGTAIASQFRLSDRWDALPVADKLFRNLFRYLAEFRPGELAAVGADPGSAARLSAALPDLKLEPDMRSSQVVFVTGAGPLPEPAAEVRARVAGGQTLIVCHLTEAARGYWQQVIGKPIDLRKPEHPVYQLVRGEPSPLLSGLSNEDTCWLTNWTYAAESANRREIIVETLLHVEGGRSLLQNATRSALDRLYGDEMATEWKRTVVLSRFFDGPAPRAAGGLVEAPLEQGRVLFWQVNWRPDLWRFHRLLGALLMNLGAPVEPDLLRGEQGAAQGKTGEGFPVRVRAARASDPALLAEVLAVSGRHTESYSGNQLFHAWPRWMQVEAPGGEIAASAVPGQGAIIIGLEVNSPEPRRFMPTIGGLPNPDLQTFLRLRGAGRVRAWVNQRLWGEATVSAGGPGWIPDIDLEGGANFVVLEWTPPAAESTLGLLFANRRGEPETTFTFG